MHLRFLKDRDRQIAAMFEEACNSLGLDLFLVSFERMHMGAAEPNPSDDDEDDYWGDPDCDYDDDVGPLKKKIQITISLKRGLTVM